MFSLFAEYWDTHSDRDAWLQQHLSSQLHSRAVPLHQWCCEHSASWARGAVHIPVFSSPPSSQPTAPSSSTTPCVTGSKRRYAAITSDGQHRPQPSSSLPPDEPLLSKAAREQEEYQQVFVVTLNFVASLGQIPGLLQELSSSTLCSANLGCSVPKSTASSLAWWVKFLDVPASFSLTGGCQLPPSSVSFSDRDRLVGEGVT